MRMNSTMGSIDMAAASGGTMGNSAGVTTPKVLAKIDISAATTPNTRATSTGGKLPPINDAKASMAPALIATEISMPTPQLLTSGHPGSAAMTLQQSTSLRIITPQQKTP